MVASPKFSGDSVSATEPVTVCDETIGWRVLGTLTTAANAPIYRVHLVDFDSGRSSFVFGFFSSDWSSFGATTQPSPAQPSPAQPAIKMRKTIPSEDEKIRVAIFGIDAGLLG